jgi:hypothetical protein
MKKGLIAILLLITFHVSLKAQNVGINTTSPAASSALTTSTYRTGSASTLVTIAIGASVQVISDGSEWRKIN